MISQIVRDLNGSLPDLRCPSYEPMLARLPASIQKPRASRGGLTRRGRLASPRGRRAARAGPCITTLAGLEHVGAVRDLKRLVRVLLDEQERHPRSRSISRMTAKMRLHDLRRQAERRLVEEQQLGPAHERARDRQHLLLAAGERARTPGHCRSFRMGKSANARSRSAAIPARSLRR